jgi:hypothetical protein
VGYRQGGRPGNPGHLDEPAAHTAGRPGTAGVTVAPGAGGRVTFVNNSAKTATITADIAGYQPS